MDFNINEFLDAFIEETRDNLESFNEEIIELEKNMKDTDLVNNIFRVAHTLKGMAGSMGYEKMRSLTHTMEDLLQDVRDGKFGVSKQLINLLFESHDYLENCLSEIVNTSKEIEIEPIELIKKLKDLHENEKSDKAVAVEEKVGEKTKKTTKTAAKKKTKKEKGEEEISAEEQEKLKAAENFEFPTEQEVLADSYDVTVHIDKECKLLVPRLFIVLKDIEDNLTVLSSHPTMTELSLPTFEYSEYTMNVRIKGEKVEEILKEIALITEVELVTCKSLAGDGEETTFEKPHEESKETDNAIEGNEKNGQVQSTNPQQVVEQHHKAEEYLRIAASKVDILADMVGELMISQSLVEQKVLEKASDDATISKEMSRMSRLTKDIQNLSMSLRMVPLKSTLQKVVRTGRDTAQTLDKEVDIEVIGEETEIDRTITEKLYTPLMHMVRNSIGHGIEDKETRSRCGKSTTGNVTISAYNKRGSVFIEIEDDGSGLNYDKILKKAIEKGLASDDKKYTNEEIANFIFLPGFSTADKVDSVSGRGVGMDVVKTDITKIGGTVRADSTPGMGTKFTLKIPINLAIMNGTIVQIVDQTYILPTLNIKEIISVNDDSWISIKGKDKMLKVRGEVLPIYPIKKLLCDSGFQEEGYDGEHDEKLMMVVELDDMLRAIPVQKVLERREIVVKSLGAEFGNLDFVSGASILGNGTVALIFDVEGLFKHS